MVSPYSQVLAWLITQLAAQAAEKHLCIFISSIRVMLYFKEFCPVHQRRGPSLYAIQKQIKRIRYDCIKFRKAKLIGSTWIICVHVNLSFGAVTSAMCPPICLLVWTQTAAGAWTESSLWEPGLVKWNLSDDCKCQGLVVLGAQQWHHMTAC